MYCAKLSTHLKPFRRAFSHIQKFILAMIGRKVVRMLTVAPVAESLQVLCTLSAL